MPTPTSKHAVIVAGPNGAGKSTTAPAILRKTLRIDQYLIERRYHAGIRNFFKLYRHQLEHWTVFDNSNSTCLNKIASYSQPYLSVTNHELWHQLLEQYNATD